MRKICVVTGTRAEYGLMHWVMQGIKDAPELTLKIIATGMSVLPEFGLTYREIEQGGFQADRFEIFAAVAGSRPYERAPRA